MKVNSENHRTVALESATIGFGPAAPPTPAALRFVTSGLPQDGRRFFFPKLRAEALQSAPLQKLATVAVNFAVRAEGLAKQAKPGLLNPFGRLPQGEARTLIAEFSKALVNISALEASAEEQRDFSHLRKLARNFSDYVASRPEELNQRYFGYMMDVLLDGSKAVLRSALELKAERVASSGQNNESIQKNVMRARVATGLMGETRENSEFLGHVQQVERSIVGQKLPRVSGGEAPFIGLTAHELAACFFAKQNACATAIAEAGREFCSYPTLEKMTELSQQLHASLDALITSGTLTDNPFSYRTNDFRLLLSDFKRVLAFRSTKANYALPEVASMVQSFIDLLHVESRFAAWIAPGMDLPERGNFDSVAIDLERAKRFDRTATWSGGFRPNRALQRLENLELGSVEDPRKFVSLIEQLKGSLQRAVTSHRAVLPVAEPFVVGLYNVAESAVLPKEFVAQTVVLQGEHRVPESNRAPNCGIMTIAPEEEIASWARQASVFTVQKGAALLGALYSFTSQKNQPELTAKLKEIIRHSASSSLLKSEAPVVCTEIVLTRKNGVKEHGRVPENRYQLMHALWQGSICSQYYDHETVLCLGVCRKNPPNTAIAAHQRLGWKIVPDVEFRFNDKATYYVMYQELHPRDSLIAQAKERSDVPTERLLPTQQTVPDLCFDSFAVPRIPDHVALSNLGTFERLPRWGVLRRSTIGLLVNKWSASIISGAAGAAMLAPPPQSFSHPKEFLLQHCGSAPIVGEQRKEIETAKRNLTSEDRKVLMQQCLFEAGSGAVIFVDKFYLLSMNDKELQVIKKELSEVVQVRFAQRSIREIIFDKLNIPQRSLLTATINFE